MVVGKKDWIIPDCELPPEGEGVLKGHESVIIVGLNFILLTSLAIKV